ncbi:MAG: hypothetical protein ACLU5J_04135 [Christensenellales bacterium]
MLNSLYNGEIDFIEPNAKPETIDELDSKKEDGFGNKSIQTSGYMAILVLMRVKFLILQLDK